MEREVSNRIILKSGAIQQINEATLVMRHFIELSSRLLPFFNELSMKEQLLPHEAEDRRKIVSVFKSYNFNTTSSVVLLNSPILDIIRKSIQVIEKRAFTDSSDADTLIERFFEEKEHLTQNWNQTELN